MENIFLVGDYTICFHFLWHVLLIMLQEANPKFYKEQLMMAKEGIELGACCHNNRERQAPGSCRVRGPGGAAHPTHVSGNCHTVCITPGKQ